MVMFESLLALILRHQSTYSMAEEKSGSLKEDALENWNAPFIITTAAQFFDSVCGNIWSRISYYFRNYIIAATNILKLTAAAI